MDVKCRFYSFKGDYDYGLSYTCIVEEIKGVASNKKIKSFTGNHEAGKTNNDVERLRILKKSIGFVPSNIHKFFPKLKNLEMWNCNLREISRKDLKGLENIEILDFFNNKLTSLPDDLFADMKKLRQIYFYGNQIERMSSNLLLPVKNTLEEANFEGNKKINDRYFNIKDDSKNDFEKFLRIIDSQCLPPLKSQANDPPSTALSPADKTFVEFSKFKTSGEFTDFTIKVHGKEFKIHKVIFAAQSSVFKKMLTDDADEESKTFNKIKNFNIKTFESFVDYFYTPKVEDSVNAKEMFELASEFDVPELKVICRQRIISKLAESNAVEVFNIAHRHQSEELKKKSFVIIKKMFPEMDDSFEGKLDEVNGLVALKAQMEAILKKK